MTNLQQRQEKIQEKRKNTLWRDFIMEIASRRPLLFYKTQGLVSRYPDSSRIGKLISFKQLYDQDSVGGIYLGDFFTDFQDMWMHSITPAVWQIGLCENADFADMIHTGKNIYLSVISVYDCENILYSFSTREGSRNVFNSMMVFDNAENVYQSAGIISSYNIFYCRFITNSNNLWFCTNCIGCNECIQCDNLMNISYCIDNKQYSPEDYRKLKLDILSRKDFDIMYGKTSIDGLCLGSTESTGSFVVDSHYIQDGYYSYNTKDAKNICFVGGANGNEHMYDIFIGGAIMGDHCYACQGAGNSEHIYCSAIINDSSFLYYCMGCSGCSFCFGCTWLNNKQFCILNKQYTKEERYKKVDEIFTQMEKDGQLGEFFPASMNPFYFNDTAAYLIDPSFTKEEVIAKGYLRRDDPIKVDIPEGAVTVKSSELTDYEGRITNSDGKQERKLDETVCKRVIIDENGDAYRIIPMEIEFLQKHGIPLPRKHRLARMRENFRIS